MRPVPDARNLYLLIGWTAVSVFFCALAVALAREIEIPNWTIFSAFLPYLIADARRRQLRQAAEDVKSVLLAAAALLGSLAVGWYVLQG